MKKLFYSIIILVVVSSVSFAEKIEVSKTYKENYSTNNQSSFYIDNKYGDIIIANWDKNEISIDLEIIVKARSKEKAEEVLKQINAKIGQEKDSIYAKTIFDEKFKSFKKVEIDIKYVVKAPAGIRYNINNKYGNIAIAEITGKTDIVLKYGNLLAKKLKFNPKQTLSNIALSYSNADIHYCNYADITLKYGKLKFGEGKAIKLAAKYSDIDMVKLETLHFDGKYGGIEIDTVSIAEVEVKYMNVTMQYLSSKLVTEIKYGNLSVNNVTPNFTTIDVEAAYGNAKLLIHPDAVYQLDAEVSYGDLSLPKKVNIERLVHKKGENIEGIVGEKGVEPKSTVSIEMDYGNVKL